MDEDMGLGACGMLIGPKHVDQHGVEDRPQYIAG